MSTRDPDLAPIQPPVTDRVALDHLAAGTSPLTPEQCMQRAHAAGALVDGSNIDRSGCARNEALVIGQPRRPGAITIHVYSPPLRAVGHYELKEGELRREACAADVPSGPSPGLLSAMTAHSSHPNG